MPQFAFLRKPEGRGRIPNRTSSKSLRVVPATRGALFVAGLGILLAQNSCYLWVWTLIFHYIEAGASGAQIGFHGFGQLP